MVPSVWAMPAFVERPELLWQVVTHLGSSSLMFPIFVLTLVGLLVTGQTIAARNWFLGLSVATVITLVSKILFYGWGIGIAAINFTGVSGHSLLAASVFPVFCHWFLKAAPAQWPYRGAVLGGAVAALVAVSRVVVGAHSASEVLVAWLMGLAVSIYTVQAMQHAIRPPWFVRLAPLVFLMALHTSTATYLPSHAWEVRLSLYLSGRDKPFQRHELL